MAALAAFSTNHSSETKEKNQEFKLLPKQKAYLFLYFDFNTNYITSTAAVITAALLGATLVDKT